jgi:hypothetical protein
MNREFFHFLIFYKYCLKFVMKSVRNINIYTLNVMIQVPVTFKIYLAFKNTWEDWGNYYFAFQEKLWNSLFIFA